MSCNLHDTLYIECYEDNDEVSFNCGHRRTNIGVSKITNIEQKKHYNNS